MPVIRMTDECLVYVAVHVMHSLTVQLGRKDERDILLDRRIVAAGLLFFPSRCIFNVAEINTCQTFTEHKSMQGNLGRSLSLMGRSRITPLRDRVGTLQLDVCVKWGVPRFFFHVTELDRRALSILTLVLWMDYNVNIFIPVPCTTVLLHHRFQWLCYLWKASMNQQRSDPYFRGNLQFVSTLSNIVCSGSLRHKICDPERCA